MLVQLQPAEVEPSEPGEPPNQPEAIEGSQTVTVVLVRDPGSVAPASLVLGGSGLIFGLLCVMLHKRDRLARPTARRLCPPPPEVDVMGQYLPVVTMGALAVVFAAVSLLMSRLLAPRRPTRRSTPLRVGHRAGP